MVAEAFISFFLLREVRRRLRLANPGSVWVERIKIILYAIVCLFVADIVFNIEFVTKWIWHALLIAIISIALLKEELSAVRSLMFAILPFAILSLLSDLIKALSIENYKLIDDYLDIAVLFSIVWMIAMVFISRKQQRALQKEHEKTQQEEEQRKWMAAKKDELEKIVGERTAELRKQKEQVETTLNELRSTQAQLIQSEKMASLGELTAGIAHEIQNPLNFVNNFSEVNAELIDEMKEAIDKGNIEQVKAIADDIKDNQKKINHHGKRADAIVKGMLQHSRNSSVEKEITDINALTDEYLRLAYHGLRAKNKSFNATLHTNFDENIGKINIIPQDVGRAILNLFTNAFYSVSEKKKRIENNYEPVVAISTSLIAAAAGKNAKVEIKVKDNGLGVPQKVVDKIFQPFFTTKPTGEGTGLGLSLSYDIITKGHSGEMKVETKEGEFAEFTILLPV
jgi:signal transduction histidine kinase